MNDRANESIARRVYGKQTVLTNALTRWRFSKGKGNRSQPTEDRDNWWLFRLSKGSNFQARLANSIENRLAIITASQSLFLLYRIYLHQAPSGGKKLQLLLHRERLVCEFSSMRKRSFRSGRLEKCGQRQVYVINVNARKQVQNWRKWTQCVLVVAALLYTWSRFPWSSPGRTPTLPSFRARMHDSRKDRTPSFNKSHLPSTLICLGKRNISTVLSNSRRDITFDSCSFSSFCFNSDSTVQNIVQRRVYSYYEKLRDQNYF